MKINIAIEAELDEKDVSSKTSLVKILKLIQKMKDESAQFKWYVDNRDRILSEEREKRALYAREQYAKRKQKKEAEDRGINQVVLPVPPADNILRFN